MTLPALPESFYWTQESWGPALRCRPLQAVAPHLFTTRQLQFTGPDGVRQVAAALDVRAVAMAHQVHGRDVVVVKHGWAPSDARTGADVFVSNRRDTAVAVRAADCVPLLIADPVSGSVAAVHAGWRGTAARASVAAIEALAREFGARPPDLIAAIGPCIGSCCYEVGTELVDAFAAAGHERYLIDRWFLAPPPRRGSRERPGLRLDLEGANRDQLVLAGVPEHQIHVAGLCTAMHLDVLTSYRAEKDAAGRLAGVIVSRGWSAVHP